TLAHSQGVGNLQDIDFVIIDNCPQGWAVGNAGAIVKLTSVTGISNYNSEIPSSYSLKQNYPNPFNPSTNINFSIPKSGIVTLKIYDMSGKEVASPLNEFKSAGNYILGFNASGLSSGAYLYRLESNDFSDSKKMFLIK
ncbi:MAG: T9SS type A sorting domain-containing protein, partial [Ignavibacteria bacterium]